MYGANDAEAAKIDVIMECAEDLRMPLVLLCYCDGEVCCIFLSLLSPSPPAPSLSFLLILPCFCTFAGFGIPQVL